MPTLDIEITCLKTRCGGCPYVQYERVGGEIGMTPRCTLFMKTLRNPDGSPHRLPECKEAEERHNTTARVVQILATDEREQEEKRCRRFIDMRGATSRLGIRS